jgi:hypothetical protein
MLIIFADGQNLAAVRRELDVPDCSLVHSIYLCKTFTSGSLPDEHVDELGFTFRCHLTCSNNVSLWMDGEGDDVFLVESEETLLVFLGI